MGKEEEEEEKEEEEKEDDDDGWEVPFRIVCVDSRVVVPPQTLLLLLLLLALLLLLLSPPSPPSPPNVFRKLAQTAGIPLISSSPLFSRSQYDARCSCDRTTDSRAWSSHPHACRRESSSRL